jgi:aldehyde dehydrogenase (NAD+)
MTKDFDASVSYGPIGVIAQIFPKNGTLSLLASNWGPALATGNISFILIKGNTIVMKSSEKSPLLALYMCHLVLETGFPPGVINVISGTGSECGYALASHMNVSKVFFTGNRDTGREIMKSAALSNMKRVCLDVGGKPNYLSLGISTNIVFSDIRIQEVVEWISGGIFYNHGKQCFTGSLIYVHASIYEEFVENFVECARYIKIGNSMDLTTEMGPLIDEKQCIQVTEYISKALEEGGKLAFGGNRLDRDGYYIEPAIFVDCNEHMKFIKDEIFGPVICNFNNLTRGIFRFADTDDVIRQVNDIEYKLSAAVHTNEMKQSEKVLYALEVETVWVNCYNLDSPQIRGQDDLYEYVQSKTIIL